MPIETYYAPVKGSQRLSLAELADRFAAGGVSLQVEPEGGNMYWLVFEGMESNLLASVQDGLFVFGTFHFTSSDPPSIAETVDQVMRSVGFSADEDADY